MRWMLSARSGPTRSGQAARRGGGVGGRARSRPEAAPGGGVRTHVARPGRRRQVRRERVGWWRQRRKEVYDRLDAADVALAQAIHDVRSNRNEPRNSAMRNDAARLYWAAKATQQRAHDEYMRLPEEVEPWRVGRETRPRCGSASPWSGRSARSGTRCSRPTRGCGAPRTPTSGRARQHAGAGQRRAGLRACPGDLPAHPGPVRDTAPAPRRTRRGR